MNNNDYCGIYSVIGTDDIYYTMIKLTRPERNRKDTTIIKYICILIESILYISNIFNFYQIHICNKSRFKFFEVFEIIHCVKHSQIEREKKPS